MHKDLTGKEKRKERDKKIKFWSVINDPVFPWDLTRPLHFSARLMNATILLKYFPMSASMLCEYIFLVTIMQT